MPKKILIVEDDPFLREMMVRKLVGSNYHADAAADGEQALKKVKDDKPDLILLDLMLPGIDGYEFLSRVQKDKATKSIPVVVLSNLGQKEEIDRAKKLGAIDFLVKAHFTPDDIVKKVKETLK